MICFRCLLLVVNRPRSLFLLYLSKIFIYDDSVSVIKELFTSLTSILWPLKLLQFLKDVICSVNVTVCKCNIILVLFVVNAAV